VSPSAARVQCPFCLGHWRIKDDGTMYAHDAGRPGLRKRCPGAGRTKEQAKAAKSGGPPYEVLSGPAGKVDAPAEVQPEDIF